MINHSPQNDYEGIFLTDRLFKTKRFISIHFARALSLPLIICCLPDPVPSIETSVKECSGNEVPCANGECIDKKNVW